ncbi:EKC/KEOPS complex subunit LAGE3-like [Desmodus rotundus]|uniref:EKC/KEOPS complex subunit LAGE3-like n=1 Tax=Desmodus rotundus TaxID=9430 RepID=UPI002380C589|nr:EKC/KEOPS complex subunit LAGE3-like [Desmodus rotundus]
MRAPGRDDDEGCDSGVGGAGSPSDPGDPMGPGDCDSTGDSDSAAAGEAPRVGRASLDLGPAGEASDSDGDLGSEVLEFTLTVPFLSDVDAEVALRFLMPGAELYHGMVLWELSVTGSDLFIRLTAEDSELLQISTVSLLIRLLIVRHIMQHLVPPVFADSNFLVKRAD